MIITFSGHRTLTDSEALAKTLKIILKDNIKNSDKVSFYCGGYGEFDNLCARVSHDTKQGEVVLITPYITKEHQHKLESAMKSGYYDSVIYPPLETVPLKYAILKRNEWMIDKADLVIVYIKHTFGGAYKSLEYARRKKKPIINIADLI